MRKITKEELGEIVALVESCPEKYREKCFELLLQNFLFRTFHLPPEGAKPLAIQEEQKRTEFIIPIDVKAFLTQYKLTEDQVKKIFIFEANEIRPIYKLKTSKKTDAQIQHAILMCLETALKEGKFSADIEAVRKRCQDEKCYDNANFMAVFKRKKELFKDFKPDEALSLSPDGKSELADLVEQLSA